MRNTAALRNLWAGLLAVVEHYQTVCGCCGIWTGACRCDVPYIGPFTETLTPHHRDNCHGDHRLACFFNADARHRRRVRRAVARLFNAIDAPVVRRG